MAASFESNWTVGCQLGTSHLRCFCVELVSPIIDCLPDFPRYYLILVKIRASVVSYQLNPSSTQGPVKVNEERVEGIGCPKGLGKNTSPSVKG